MEEHAIAERITELLAARGEILGTIESGTDGRVSHVIFDTSQGPRVLGSSVIVEAPEEVVEILELPWPQLQKAGAFSAKAARAAARKGRTLLGVHVCIVVWGEGLIGEDDERETVYLAVNVNDEIRETELEVAGAAALEEVIDAALTLVAQALHLR
ncbi:MAG: CinA family protein [Anaerolineales bacterium]